VTPTALIKSGCWIFTGSALPLATTPILRLAIYNPTPRSTASRERKELIPTAKPSILTHLEDAGFSWSKIKPERAGVLEQGRGSHWVRYYMLCMVAWGVACGVAIGVMGAMVS
jgi:hypothetical protein